MPFAFSLILRNTRTRATSPCGRVAHCRTLPLWQGLEQVIGAYLDQFTLADLVSPEAYVQPGK